MKRYFSIVLRVLVTFALLYYLYRKVGWNQVVYSLKDANLFWLVPAALLFFLFLLVSNWRWKVLLDARGMHFTFSYLLKVYLVAWMFNNVLPTAIGGDVARIAYTIRDNRQADAFAATLVDRIVGFIGLFFFALLASLLLLFLVRQSPTIGGVNLLLLNITGFVVLLLVTLAIFTETAYRIVMGVLGQISLFRIGERIDQLYQAVRAFRCLRAPLLFSFIASLAIQFILALVWYLTAMAPPVADGGGRPALVYYCIGIPLIGITTMLPSIGGLGIRENGIVAFFTAPWVTGAMSIPQATTTAILYLAMTLIYAVVGFLIFQVTKRTSATAPERK